jgi:hypothetical protein
VKGRWVFAAAIAVALILPSAAAAATVELRAGAGPAGTTYVLAVVAAPGERNAIVLRSVWDVPTVPGPAGGYWLVSDSGSELVAGASCSAVDPHSVRCQAPGFAVAGVTVELGDMDDSFVAYDNSGSIGGSATVEGGSGNDTIAGAPIISGGPGDDELVGHPYGHPASFGNLIDGGPGDDRVVGAAGFDELHGGGGVDELIGGDSNDRLFDDDTADGAAPGPDRLDGGPGTDLVSYERRTAPIIANLAAASGAGERGEGDQLTDVESLAGGSGDDRLTGDAGANVLDGGRGRDRLSGRAGNDEFIRAEGAVFCGGDIDTVRGGRSSRDFLQPDCELVASGYDGGTGANPGEVTRRAVRFLLRCPLNDDEELIAPYRICGPGTLRLREVDGRQRVLAAGRFPAGRWDGRMVTARLTALGRRLAARRQGVHAKVRLGGYYPAGPSLRWSIRLKVPG